MPWSFSNDNCIKEVYDQRFFHIYSSALAVLASSNKFDTFKHFV